jgi:AraC-like DNA-binding protein
VTLPSSFVGERIEDGEGLLDHQHATTTLVARSALSNALSHSAARRITHDRQSGRVVTAGAPGGTIRTMGSHGFSLDEAATAVSSSKRTLARRMHAVQGKSPLSYFQSLRVERAVQLLKTGNESVDQIAARVGYADGVTLRTLLRRHLGHGIRDIRRAD